MKTRVEFRAVKKDTEYVILGIIAFEADENNEITKIFGAFDAYFEDEIEKEIQRSFIVSDGLTGIQLQKKFAKDVDNYLTLNPDSKNALVFIDIDDMTLINSMFGYEYGNSFIKEIAAKLRNFQEEHDIFIGKATADKFLVFVKNANKLRDLIVFIDTLHKNLRRTYHTTKEIGVFTVTMGVSKFPQDGKNFKELYNNAEFASKAAKLNKRSTYAFFNPAMKDFSQIAADISNIESLPTSNKAQNFFPVVDKKTGELVCYDFNPFAGALSKIAFTSDLYHAVNKTEANVKNFSLLAIKNLLLTCFWTLCPELVINGHIHAAIPPLFRITTKKNDYIYLRDAAALEEYKRVHAGEKYAINRNKGLGEQDPQELAECLLNHETRNVAQITVEDVAEANRLFEEMMNEYEAWGNID
jgi:diguanylate cyclase (GGDEF)-like protein